MHNKSKFGVACGLAVLATMLACSDSSDGKVKVPENVAAISAKLDFDGSSVRITGTRTPPANGSYACANAFSSCLSFASDGTTDVIMGLCPSENAPAGTWDFSYEVFDSTDCTGDPLPNFDCADTLGETLPAGQVTTNSVTCSSQTAGKTWDFDSVNVDPECPDGSVCVDAGPPDDAGPPLNITYSGSATAALTSLGLEIGSVGPLSPAGGSLSDSLINITVGPLGTFGALTVQTQGIGTVANSSATISDVDFGTISGLIGLTATTLGSTSQASCPPGVIGASTITDLALIPLIGPPITIVADGSPNQVVLGLPVGVSLTLNEQVTTVTGTTADITVNAVNLNVLGLEIILGQSHSDVDCDP